MYLRSVSGGQAVNGRPRCKHRNNRISRARPSFDIPCRRPAKHRAFPKQPIAAIDPHETAIRQWTRPSGITHFYPLPIDPRRVQRRIHLIGKYPSVLPRIFRSQPRFPEIVISLTAAFGARPMARGQRHGLIQEEQLRVASGRHHRTPAASKLEHARDPAPARVLPHDSALIAVYRAATVSHERSARRVGENLSFGRDAILQRHAEAGLGQPHSPHIDLRVIKNAQTKRAGDFDMLHLAVQVMAVFVRFR